MQNPRTPATAPMPALAPELSPVDLVVVEIGSGIAEVGEVGAGVLVILAGWCNSIMGAKTVSVDISTDILVFVDSSPLMIVVDSFPLQTNVPCEVNLSFIHFTVEIGSSAASVTSTDRTQAWYVTGEEFSSSGSKVS